jgi:hypothetical protein
MNNNKQSSSIEWLHVEFQKRFPKETAEMYNNNQLLYEQMIEQAKAIHKEEIEEAYDTGKESTINARLSQNSYRYYNETFGGNNEQQ